MSSGSSSQVSSQPAAGLSEETWQHLVRDGGGGGGGGWLGVQSQEKKAGPLSVTATVSLGGK